MAPADSSNSPILSLSSTTTLSAVFLPYAGNFGQIRNFSDAMAFLTVSSGAMLNIPIADFGPMPDIWIKVSKIPTRDKIQIRIAQSVFFDPQMRPQTGRVVRFS